MHVRSLAILVYETPTDYCMNLTHVHARLIFIASQMWCFARFLPLVIGDLVPDDDEHWCHYAKLLEIIDYVFAPVITPDKASYIGMLIEDFLEEFRELYPERRLIPKMHYMVHIPSWILKYVHEQGVGLDI